MYLLVVLVVLVLVLQVVLMVQVVLVLLVLVVQVLLVLVVQVLVLLVVLVVLVLLVLVVLVLVVQVLWCWWCRCWCYRWCGWRRSSHLHLGQPADLQLEGASLDVLVVQAERQGEVSVLGDDVDELVGSVLVVDQLAVHDAAVRREDLGGGAKRRC